MASPDPGELFLDHNAGSPTRREALEAMLPWLGASGANPSSLHRGGQAARRALEGARATVARFLGGGPRDWVFTSGATESCNLALRGAAAGRPVLVGATEHPAVLETVRGLAESGTEVETLPVDARGVVDLGALGGALDRHPGALVALMAANNETGVLHPVAEAARLCRDRGALLFCDASQAAGKSAWTAPGAGPDLAAASAVKFGGPPGCGLLYVRPGLDLIPWMRGGHQERGLRPGTENVAAAVGAAAALEAATSELAGREPQWRAAVEALEVGLADLFPGLVVHGAGAPRVANTSCVGLPVALRDLLLVRLDDLGLRASPGAACAAGSAQPSHVLAAMGVPPAALGRALRFSFGPGQGLAQARDALGRLARALGDLRRAGLA